MPELVNATKALWRLATLKIVLYSFATLWACWSTATQNLDMTLLGWYDWAQTIGGCIGAWCLTMMAFIDKSAAQLLAGHMPGLDDSGDGKPAVTEIKP